jgi:hypothetical protein
MFPIQKNLKQVTNTQHWNLESALVPKSINKPKFWSEDGLWVLKWITKESSSLKVLKKKTQQQTNKQKWNKTKQEHKTCFNKTKSDTTNFFFFFEKETDILLIGA